MLALTVMEQRCGYSNCSVNMKYIAMSVLIYGASSVKTTNYRTEEPGVNSNRG